MTGRKRNIRRQFKDFNKLDKIVFDFQNQLITSLKSIIRKHYPNFEYNNQTELEFKHFAHQLFNATESVIDKDFNYPIYRLKRELFIMQQLANEKDQSINKPEFFKALQQPIKKLAVDFFPGVFNLSGNGFRLLEVNLNYVIYSFLEWFFNDMPKE